MADSVDDDRQFFARADSHIKLANDHLREDQPQPVCMSMLFAAARFSAWTTSTEFDTAEAMETVKQERIDALMGHFKEMLEANMGDYIANLQRYKSAKNPEDV